MDARGVTRGNRKHALDRRCRQRRVGQCPLSQVVNPAPFGALVNPGFEVPALVGWAFRATSVVQHTGSAWVAPSAPQGTQTAAFVQHAGSIAQAISLNARELRAVVPRITAPVQRGSVHVAREGHGGRVS
jgi:hypothetical protein